MLHTYLGGVEEVDTVVPGSFQALLGALVGLLGVGQVAHLDDVAFLSTTIGEPATQTEYADFETSRAKVAEHLSCQ